MITDVYKLTPMQMGMFFHSLLDKKSTAYFEQFLFSLNGEINPGLLEKSFNRLMERYDILRTIFHIDKKDQPIQIVLKQRQCKIHWEDIAHLNKDEQVRYVKDFLARDKEKGFDLTRDILIRLSLLRTGANTHQLVWSFHHILMDGWCLGIIFKELISIYHSLQKDEPLKLEPVTPYAQYIKWLEKQDKVQGLRYWREYLEGYKESAGMEKFGKRETSKKEKYKVETHKFTLEEAITTRLKTIAARYNATINTVFQALWGILLQRYNNTGDVVYGAVVSGRPPGLQGIENMVGLFINTVPVRVTLPADKTFSQLVRDLQAKAVEAKSYEYLPLAEIQAQSLLKNKLIDHIMAFENYPIEQQVKNNNAEMETQARLSVKNVNVFEQTNYHFNILASPGERLTIAFNFNSYLLEPSFVKRTAGHLMEMANQIATNPEILGKDIEIITPAEKHQLLTQFNETKKEYPKDKTLHEYFNEQVEQIPDHTALIGENPGQHAQHLTYRELEKISTRLARELQEKGIRTDSIVGLKIERCLEMIIGIWGILKAGGAYLPIDPDYPGERVNYMLADSGAKILLTRQEIAAFFLEKTLNNRPGGPFTHRHRPSASIAGLAYVIYTSGTTGKPKGNLIIHANVIRVVKKTNYIELTSRDRVLQLSNYAFDGSVFDIYGALTNGAVLVLVNRDRLLALEQLAAFIKQQQITVFFVTTALFNTLVETQLHCFAQVRKILFGGERVSPGHCRKALDYMGKNRLLHMYGPTETTVYATYYEVDQIQKEADNIPIGKPITNTGAYILDFLRHPVPIGITGQLYIGGEGLARGYLNNPGLTAEKFDRDLWDYLDYRDLKKDWKSKKVPGKRNNMSYRSNRSTISYLSSLYQTGDLVRWQWDGNIEFMGRIDTQVKIRGFRIEMGEIENQLLKQEAIIEAVVLARFDERGEKYLCAYVVPGGDIEIGRLKAKLARYLPIYMIPAYFVMMEKIPLTPNGKIDRKALPVPVPGEDQGYRGPGNPEEEQLTEIWSEILGIDKNKISTGTSFFDLGGHSLRATALVSRIHKNLNVKITLAQVFKTPTIRGLSEHIKNVGKERHDAIPTVEKRDYYNLSSPQKRLYVLQQMQENNIGYNMPRTLPLTFTVDNQKEKLQFAFQKLIARHESLRTSFHMMEDEPVQKIHDRVEFEIEYKEFEVEVKIEEGQPPLFEGRRGYAPLSIEPAAQSPKPEAALLNSFIRPFDLSQAPLLRVGLVGLPPTPGAPLNGLLLIDMHHIITDAASQAILNKEINRLYEGKTLPLLKLQYKDYAQWQNSKEQQARIAYQKNYWIKMLSADGEIPVLNLPIDHPRPINQDFSGNTVSFVIKETRTSTLEKIAKKAEATLYMAVLSVFYLLLAKLSSQEDIIIGTPVAARRHTDLERIIGMFVNTLALRNYPSGEKTFTGFLQEVKKRTLEAFENQEYQFEELVENLSVPRDTGRNPIFDVMFNWLNQADYQNSQTSPEREISTTHLYQHKKGVSKFDLTLIVVHLEEKLLFVVEYCTKLFKSHTIDRIIEYFKRIFDLLFENPHQKLSQIDIIAGQEKNRILYEFNHTDADYPKNKTIGQLFEEQAKQTPDQIALTGSHKLHCEGTRGLAPLSALISITYRQLNQKSHQLAVILNEKGVKPDNIVGIMMERSIEMIIGIFAILKTGGAYLPIDPDYPPERIDFMLKDSGAEILLKDNDFTPEALNNRPKGTPSHLHLLPAPATSLAYVIYTSGTIGKPKGVLIDHHSVVRLMKNDGFQFDFNETDIWTLFHSFCFDFSVWEMYGALLYGGKLIIIPKMTARDTVKFLQILKRHRVTVLNQTPTAFYNLVNLELKDSQRWLTLRYVIFGGEALGPGRLKEWKAAYPRTRLINMYGITETTVHVTFKEITDSEIATNTSNIGKPIPTLIIYLMDKYLRLVPVGVAGELCVGGIGISRGYLNRPGLTLERFTNYKLQITNKKAPVGQPLQSCNHSSMQPYSHETIQLSINHSPQYPITPSPHHPIYQSGDLARWFANGELEYLGRIDQQVKIRGFRIELGEIENQLLHHDEIKELVVISRENENKEKYLCAYFVSKRDLPAAELREYLSKFMPDYMIPAYFVQIEKIPLTANGKVDRKALPEPVIKTKENFIPPADVIEKQLAEIWWQVLGRHTAQPAQIYDSIGINDNFFEIGGHSLKATAMTAKIQKQFQVNLSLAQVFNTPTIRQLAGYIKTHGKEINITKDHHLVLIKKEKNSPNHLFFIHDGTGEVEAYIEFCNALNSGYNCWGIKAHGFENYTPQNITIEDLAQKYIQVLQRVQLSPPYHISGWSLGGIIAFEMVRQLERQNREVDFFALIDAPLPNRDSLRPPGKFTLEYELNWVKNYLPADIYEKIQEASQPAHLWQLIVQQLEIKNVDIKKIKGILAQLGGQGISYYEHMNIPESIRYLNMLRSFARARTHYIPKGKINTPIHYFKAGQSKQIKHENWEDYSLQSTTFYKIQGDHYTIFRSPQVTDFAKIFEQIMKR